MMSFKELDDVLAMHKLWLEGEDGERADLSGANLSGANLSRAKGLLSTVNYLDAHFERTPDGYIAYKTFNCSYKAPQTWVIKPGSVIEENVNFDRCTSCGCGINVAPLKWVKKISQCTHMESAHPLGVACRGLRTVYD